MASWPSFYFHSSSIRYKLLFLLLPLFFLFALFVSYFDSDGGWGDFRVLLIVSLFYFAVLAIRLYRINSVWKHCGGWCANFIDYPAIGIKPPRISQLADREIGKRIYVNDLSPDEGKRDTLSHEMSHAFTVRIKHPAWLQEGLAMVVAEKFLEKQTIRTDTLDILKESLTKKISRSLSVDNAVLLYARGYWRTRYLVETNRELLGLLFNPQYKAADFENLIADSYGEKSGSFWSKNKLDQMLLKYFELSQNAAGTELKHSQDGYQEEGLSGRRRLHGDARTDTEAVDLIVHGF